MNKYIFSSVLSCIVTMNGIDRLIPRTAHSGSRNGWIEMGNKYVYCLLGCTSHHEMITLFISAFLEWDSCQIRQIVGAHAPGMPGTFSPPPLLSNSDMHHGTCVRHIPWCMPGSLTRGFLWIRRRGKTPPGDFSHKSPVTLCLDDLFLLTLIIEQPVDLLVTWDTLVPMYWPAINNDKYGHTCVSH